MLSSSRLTIKYQATIPRNVREALELKAGDSVEFVIKGKSVSIRKTKPRLSDEVAFRLTQVHAMRDWDTPEDDEAFRDL
jgi:AbrB family looped-hinge helix DNA binding protein